VSKGSEAGASKAGPSGAMRAQNTGLSSLSSTESGWRDRAAGPLAGMGGMYEKKGERKAEFTAEAAGGC
jgi:hypothetical protein